MDIKAPKNDRPSNQKNLPHGIKADQRRHLF